MIFEAEILDKSHLCSKIYHDRSGFYYYVGVPQVIVIDKLLGSKLRAKTLGWLFSHPDQRYFVRQLETILAEDKTNLSRELARLAEMGILVSQSEGRQKYYRANRDCPIFDDLQGLLTKTVGVADVLRQALAPLAERIDFALLYGSVARREFGLDSDVDVLVVGSVTFAEVVAAVSVAQEHLAREVNPAVFPKEEFQRKLHAGGHFLKDVMKGPRILLIGDERELAELAESRLADST